MVNDIKNLDNEIIKSVEERLFIRKRDLIKNLQKMENIKSSLPTINRHINYLIKIKQIMLLKYPKYQKFGIFDKDQRATYITLSKNSKLIKHYDTVITSLNSADLIKKRNALIELESMKNITLPPFQLTELSNLLLKEDRKLGETIIKVIYNHFFIKLVFPSDLKKLQENLITYHKNNCGKIKEEVKNHILCILGILGNPAVIDFLKKEIEEGTTFDRLKGEGYTQWFVAKIMEDNKTYLFNFQNSLENKGRIDLVFKIRKEAEQNFHFYYERDYARFKKGLEGLEK